MLIQKKSPKVWIVILNWNGWQDTVECLESVLRMDYPSFQVVVCDNASTNDSVAHIVAWADGHQAAASKNSSLAKLSQPPIAKPISYRLLPAASATLSADTHSSDLLTVIETGGNLGFSGGNNVGIRFAQQDPAMHYVWLLNNDCVVLPDALTHLVERAEMSPKHGMVGSTLRYYHDPKIIQSLGGARLNKWTCVSRPIGDPKKNDDDLSAPSTHRMDYVEGASILASRSMLEQVGLLAEEYFLYYEEIDWAERAAKMNFSLAYAPKSIVYHKEGASTLGNHSPRFRSLKADFYMNRSRVLFMRKFYPRRLPVLYATLLLGCVRRIFWKQPAKAWQQFKIVASLSVTRIA